jgi:uncharacterized protein YegL
MKKDKRSNKKVKKGYTHISVVLDRSGSMASCLKDTIGGFNQFLKTQKELEGEATMTLVQFDDQYEMLMDMVPITNASELNDKTYVPRGWTALLDAIGRTINSVEFKIAEKDEKPEKVIFVIITDGEENKSREFNREQIMKMIDAHRSENKWEFVFIGANQDAIKAGGDIGVRAASSLNYVATSAGTTDMYASLTKCMTSYRSRSLDKSMEMGFFTPDKKD